MNENDRGDPSLSDIDDSSTTNTPVRSRMFELKQRLMRRAWDGDSALAADGAEMMKIIQKRLAQCKLSEDHADILEETRLMDYDQPRSIRMLNALARANGSATRFSETDGKTVH